jgi:hypothetical protein
MQAEFSKSWGLFSSFMMLAAKATAVLLSVTTARNWLLGIAALRALLPKGEAMTDPPQRLDH